MANNNRDEGMDGIKSSEVLKVVRAIDDSLGEKDDISDNNDDNIEGFHNLSIDRNVVGGRILENNQPVKKVNSPESPVDRSLSRVVVDRIENLKRFLLIGSDKGRYMCKSIYTSVNKSLLCENESLIRLAEQLYQTNLDEVLDLLVKYSENAISMTPTLLVLAIGAASADLNIRKKSFKKLNEICKTPTHLFEFLNHLQERQQHNPKETTGDKDTKKLSKKGDRKRKHPEGTATNENAKKSKLRDGKKRKNKGKKRHREKRRKETYKFNRSSGWGRMMRKVIGGYYTEKDAFQLLCLLTRYKRRWGRTHSEVLAYAHPKFEDNAKNLVIAYVTRGHTGFAKVLNQINRNNNCCSQDDQSIQQYVGILEEISKLKPTKIADEKKLIEILKDYTFRWPDEQYFEIGNEENNTHKKKMQVTFEHIPSGFLNKPEVWKMLLMDIPLHTLIRNLSRLTKLKVFDNKDSLQKAIEKIKEIPKRKINCNPLKMFMALNAYRCGENLPNFTEAYQGYERIRVKKYKWEPNDEIVEAMNQSLNQLFSNKLEICDVGLTEKNILIALDFNDPYEDECDRRSILKIVDSAVIMALCLFRIYKNCTVTRFALNERSFEKDKVGLKDITLEMRNLSSNNEIDFSNLRTYIINSAGNYGCLVDAAAPMQYALERHLDVDAFIIFTGSNQSKSATSPIRSLENYRASSERRSNAGLIFCAMTTDQFTIANPDDRRTLDICGFDLNIPLVISEFLKSL